MNFSKKATTSITVNGRTYNSVDEMEPEVRRQYEEMLARLTADRDGNGIPDIFERPPAGSNDQHVVITSMSHRVILDGKEVDVGEKLPAHMLEQLPADVRQSLEDFPAAGGGRPGRRVVERPAAMFDVKRDPREIRMTAQSLGALLIVVAALAAGVVWMFVR